MTECECYSIHMITFKPLTITDRHAVEKRHPSENCQKQKDGFLLSQE